MAKVMAVAQLIEMHKYTINPLSGQLVEFSWEAEHICIMTTGEVEVSYNATEREANASEYRADEYACHDLRCVRVYLYNPSAVDDVYVRVEVMADEDHG